LFLCGKHYICPNVERALTATAADVVVCLCEEHELAERYPEYVQWLLANVPTRAVWSPVPDFHAPSLNEAVELLTLVRTRLDRGETVLMHCAGGIGRTGTMAAALLITMGMSRADALALVASSRPMAGPEVGAQTELLNALARG
jgi:protein-tyrosine phosphatase